MSWTSEWSRSDHCVPDFAVSTPSSISSGVKGRRIVIFWRSRCSDLMVLSVSKIHPQEGGHALQQNVACLSFVALDRSIGLGTS